MSSRPILVIGSTGKTGRRIVSRLTGGGHRVRPAGRRTDPPFSWEQPSSWPAVLHGAGSAYIAYAPDLAVPSAPAAIEALVSYAIEAGLEHLVLLSGRGEHHAQRCEKIVQGSGLSHTLIRASWFAQNFSEGDLLEQVRRGMITLPAGQVAEPFVDVEDIADVAVAALTDDRHSGRLYELTGPRLLTFADAAAEISAAAGHPVGYTAVAAGEFRAALAEETGPEYADLFTALCEELFDGRNATLGRGVQDALGREPRDFAGFCRSAAASGVWQR
ncbi:SDR family oxidoreductase [Nonomuraea salmonea]|uniref:SDR family oxidoreductase n=1 Tax=Nonomuraea salmonea TaxID=46181 RepID=A0ABV5P206_9ACTN